MTANMAGKSYYNKDILSFIESCCDQSTAIQNEPNRPNVNTCTLENL